MSTTEDLFKDSFSGFEKEPSEKLWQNIEKRLAWQRFWKFDFKTFNVWYLAVAERVARFKGKMNIESTPGKGTHVSVTIST